MVYRNDIFFDKITLKEVWIHKVQVDFDNCINTSVLGIFIKAMDLRGYFVLSIFKIKM